VIEVRIGGKELVMSSPINSSSSWTFVAVCNWLHDARHPLSEPSLRPLVPESPRWQSSRPLLASWRRTLPRPARDFASP